MSTTPTPTVIDLPDGSQCSIEAISDTSSIVSREVAGECVWGQVFSKWSTEEHATQIAGIVADMTANPTGFSRWWAA